MMAIVSRVSDTSPSRHFPLGHLFLPDCIYNYNRYVGSHKTLSNYRKKEKGEKQTNQLFTTFSRIRRDTGLHLTDRPIYPNSLQSPFLDVKYFCIKLCRLLSATCLTD